jgi:hypothetical protein
MPIDRKRINDFLSRSPSRLAVANILQRAEFEIDWVVEHTRDLWGVYLKLNRDLRQLFRYILLSALLEDHIGPRSWLG